MFDMDKTSIFNLCEVGTIRDIAPNVLFSGTKSSQETSIFLSVDHVDNQYNLFNNVKKKRNYFLEEISGRRVRISGVVG